MYRNEKKSALHSFGDTQVPGDTHVLGTKSRQTFFISKAQRFRVCYGGSGHPQWIGI